MLPGEATPMVGGSAGPGSRELSCISGQPWHLHLQLHHQQPQPQPHQERCAALALATEPPQQPVATRLCLPALVVPLKPGPREAVIAPGSPPNLGRTLSHGQKRQRHGKIIEKGR